MPRAVFLGLTTIDVGYEVETLPHANEKIVAAKHEVRSGGPATNAAITCAFLGGGATLVSAVGGHPLAAIAREELARFHVARRDLSPGEIEPPPISSIAVTAGSGERAIISAHATRSAVPAERFDPSVLSDCVLLLLDGHQMNCAILAAMQAHARGIPVVLDGGSWKERTQELLPHVTYAICSDDFHPPGIHGIRQTIAYVLDQGARAVAITRGPEPVIWATHEQQGEVEVPRVRVVDTTGAGDIFHGAFCYQLMRSAPFPEALLRAARTAAYSCQFFGTRAWMDVWPTLGGDNPKLESH